MRLAAIVTAALFVFLLLLSGVLHSVGIINLRVWGVLREDAKREVFEESQSFVQGKVTHLNRLRLEYSSTESDSRRAALRTMILQEAVTLERDNLPDNLRAFLDTLEITP